jgi:hypothetical protein
MGRDYKLPKEYRQQNCEVEKPRDCCFAGIELSILLKETELNPPDS